MEEFKQRLEHDDSENDQIVALPHKKRGRHLFLGNILDEFVQRYLIKLREGIITANIAMAAAKEILIGCDKSRLSEHGGHIELLYGWSYSLLRRMNFMKRKATTAKVNSLVSTLKRAFLRDVALTVEMENIDRDCNDNFRFLAGCSSFDATDKFFFRSFSKHQARHTHYKPVKARFSRAISSSRPHPSCNNSRIALGTMLCFN